VTSIATREKGARVKDPKALGACLAVLLFLAPAAADATVVFDNFGPADAYDAQAGWTVGFEDIWFTQADAFSVTATGAYRLDRIELAMRLVSGANQLTVALHRSVGGLPGPTLESFSFVGMMGPDDLPAPPLGASSVLRPVLQGGQQYWLVVSAPDPTTWASWHYNTIGHTGPHAMSTLGEPFSVSDLGTGAFRITAAPDVPEPGSLFLAGSGLLLLLPLRRRRIG
jgi:hypothetical protein